MLPCQNWNEESNNTDNENHPKNHFHPKTHHLLLTHYLQHELKLVYDDLNTTLYLFWEKPYFFFLGIFIFCYYCRRVVVVCLALFLPIVVKPLTLQSLILFLFVHWKRYFVFVHYLRSLSSAKTWSNMKMDISLLT